MLREVEQDLVLELVVELLHIIVGVDLVVHLLEPQRVEGEIPSVHLKTQLRHFYTYLPTIYLCNDRILPVSRHKTPPESSTTH